MTDDTVRVPREPTEEMILAGMAAMNELVRPIAKPMERPSIDQLEKLLKSEAPPGVQIRPDGSVDTLEERTTTTRAAALAAYRAMLSAAPQPSEAPAGWIAVGERLPEEEVEVLISHIIDDHQRTYDTACLQQGQWTLPWDRGGRNYKPLTWVTHWMPLPPAPEKESK